MNDDHSPAEHVQSVSHPLSGWPFLMFIDRASYNTPSLYRRAPTSNEGFMAQNIEFEVATSSNTAHWTRSVLSDAWLSFPDPAERDPRLLVERSFDSSVRINLFRGPCAPKRMITELRWHRHVYARLVLEVDLAANAGAYDEDGQVTIDWGRNPHIHVKLAISDYPFPEKSEPFSLYFQSLDGAQKVLSLGRIEVPGKVLEPMRFWLRFVGVQAETVVLHPVLQGQGEGTYPPHYPAQAASDAGLFLLLDSQRYPSEQLSGEDILGCARLMLGDHVALEAAVEDAGEVVRGIYKNARQLHVEPQPEAAGYCLDPLVKVISEGETVELLYLGYTGVLTARWSLDGQGKIESDGIRCTYQSPKLEPAGADLPPALVDAAPDRFWALCYIAKIMATHGQSETATAAVVVLRKAPTGYLASRGTSGGSMRLKLCYRNAQNEEVEVSLDDTFWDGYNCFVTRAGVVELDEGEDFCIIRAYDSYGNSGAWAVLVLPVPLLDSETVQGLDIV